MSSKVEAKRHHFLPQQAYLRRFSIAGKGEKIAVYRRGKAPFVTSLINVGVETDLYSLINQQGGLDRRLETEVLSSLDGRAVGVMDLLNNEPNKVALNTEELDTIHDSVALAMLRTPAFRDKLNRLDVELLERGERADPTIRSSLRQMNLAEEAIDFYIQAGLARAREIVAHPNYWLVRVGRFLELTAPVLRDKSAEILETDEIIITSDNPVVYDYNLGLLRSDLVFPIGSHRVLVFRTSCSRTYEAAFIPVRRITRAQARDLNLQTIKFAEQALFASVERQGIHRLLNAAKPPARMSLAERRFDVGNT